MNAPAPQTSRPPFSGHLPCTAPPILALDDGRGCFVATEDGIWWQVGTEGQVRALAPLALHSVALLNARGELIVATFGAELATTVRDSAWTLQRRDALVLSLAETAAGMVLGDATGNLTCLTPSGAPRVLVAGEPVTELAAVGEWLAVLGAQGSIGLTAWPVKDGPLLEVVTSPLEGPWALFRATRPGCVGVLAATRAGLVDVDTRRVTAISAPVADGLRSISALGTSPYSGYGLLTDTGELWLLDAALGAPHRVRLPAGAGILTGFRATHDDGGLAWTSTGELYLVDASRLARRMAAGDVVMAYPAPQPGRAIVIQWSPEAGARLQSIKLA